MLSTDLAHRRALFTTLEAAEAEVRRLKAELGRVQEDLDQARAQLAGRDQEIRALREKITARVHQVGVGGAEAQGAQTPVARPR